MEIETLEKLKQFDLTPKQKKILQLGLDNRHLKHGDFFRFYSSKQSANMAITRFLALGLIKVTNFDSFEVTI